MTFLFAILGMLYFCVRFRELKKEVEAGASSGDGAGAGTPGRSHRMSLRNRKDGNIAEGDDGDNNTTTATATATAKTLADRLSWRRTMLLALAVTIHNIPEVDASIVTTLFFKR